MSKARYMEWTPERVARFWEWQSQFPDQYFTNILGKRIASRLSKYIKQNGRVLDLGCGLGHLIPHLAGYAREVVGLDASPAAVAATRARAAHLGNFGGVYLLDELNQISGKFDTITVIEVIEHLTEAQFHDLVKTVRSLLAQDGLVIFTTPNDEPLEQSMVLSPDTGELFHRYQHMRNWTAKSLRDAVEADGLDVVEVLETDFSLTRRILLRRLVSRIIRLNRLRPVRKPHLMCVAKLRSGS